MDEYAKALRDQLKVLFGEMRNDLVSLAEKAAAEKRDESSLQLEIDRLMGI